MTLRKCKHCGLEAHTENDLELFATSKNAKHNRMNRCKECHNKDTKNWYRTNKEQRLIKVKEWYKNNKERRVKSHKNWCKINKDRIAAYSAKRRAVKLNATPAWADHEIINDFYLEAKYHGMEVDHIIPLQHELVCGLHVEHNLQLLTKEQNCSKGNSFENYDQ